MMDEIIEMTEVLWSCGQGPDGAEAGDDEQENAASMLDGKGHGCVGHGME